MAELSFTVRHEGDLTTLTLTGNLDENTAPTLRPTLEQLVASKPPRVEADLAKLELIDEAGCAALVGLYKHLEAEGSSFKVINADGQPREIFKLLRYDRLFL